MIITVSRSNRGVLEALNNWEESLGSLVARESVSRIQRPGIAILLIKMVLIRTIYNNTLNVVLLINIL